jgi:Family of unknown function (DUF6011)
MEGQRFIRAEDAMAFVQGGNAIFTVVSTKTGTRFTYKVTEMERGNGFLVGVLTGPDNNDSYRYMGIINQYGFKATKNSKIAQDAPSWIAFKWVYWQLSKGQLLDTVEIWHAGRCGRCGLTLTVPSSISSGFGPKCTKIRGGDTPRCDPIDDMLGD